jgi:hypothetical protein
MHITVAHDVMYHRASQGADMKFGIVFNRIKQYGGACMAALSWFEDHGCGVRHTSISLYSSINDDNHTTSSKVDGLRGTLSVP